MSLDSRPSGLEEGLAGVRTLNSLDRDVLRIVVGELLLAISPHRRNAMRRRLRRVMDEYCLIRAHMKNNSESIARWAALVMQGKLDSPARCSALTLLRHKALALDHLAGLPSPHRDPDAWSSALRERLCQLFQQMSKFRCSCGQSHVVVPPVATLTAWPTTPGAVAERAIAWYHRLRPEMAHKQLVRASKESERIRQELSAASR